MLLEYLIESEENAEKCRELLNDGSLGFTKKKFINDTYIITITTKSEDKSSANKLSDINIQIVDLYNPIVLINGSASYYNRVLFPLVNDFERKLRTLLYTASKLKPDQENTIENLENKDLGAIFKMVFLDQNYVQKVKNFVGCKDGNGSKDKNRAWQGYSSDLRKYLEEETEDLLWDRLLPGQVPTLREEFTEIRIRRNEVMHAHNIDKADFNKTKKLFKKVNEELDRSIEQLGDGSFIPDDYNQEINKAVIFISCEATESLDSEINV